MSQSPVRVYEREDGESADWERGDGKRERVREERQREDGYAVRHMCFQFSCSWAPDL